MINEATFLENLLSVVLDRKEAMLTLGQAFGIVNIICSEAQKTLLDYLKEDQCPELLHKAYETLKALNDDYLISCVNIVSPYSGNILECKDTTELVDETYYFPNTEKNESIKNSEIIDSNNTNNSYALKNINDIKTFLSIDAAYTYISYVMPKMLKSPRTNKQQLVKKNQLMFLFEYKYEQGEYKSVIERNTYYGKGSCTQINNLSYCYRFNKYFLRKSNSDPNPANYELSNLRIDSNGKIFIDSNPALGKLTLEEFVEIYSKLIEISDNQYLGLEFIVTYEDSLPITKDGFYSILNTHFNQTNPYRIKFHNIKLPSDLSSLGKEESIDYYGFHYKKITLDSSNISYSKNFTFYNSDGHNRDADYILPDSDRTNNFSYYNVNFEKNNGSIVVFTNEASI